MLAKIFEQFSNKTVHFFHFFDLKNIGRGVKKLATIQIHFFY